MVGVIHRTISVLLLSAAACLAHQGHPHRNPAHDMRAAAQALLASLDKKQKAAALLAFDSGERENWHFVPKNDRQGLRLGDLTPAQRPSLYALLDTGLSESGLLTASSIIALEQYLAEKENNPKLRDPEKYFLTVFGEPSPDRSWGWRFEGHHLSLNYTIVDGKTVTYTPAFFGTNPAEIKEGPRKGLRPLGPVEDRARALVRAAVKAHPELVFSQKAPRDIITHQNRTAEGLAPKGIQGKDLPPALREQLRDTIAVVTKHLGALPEAGDPVSRVLEAEAGEAWFAWAGGTEAGQAHYFRIQSPGLLIEYANTQNNANHAHLVLRFPDRDFGRDLLKEHYQTHHREP